MFSYCIENPKIPLVALCDKFCFLKPVDVFYLLEVRPGFALTVSDFNGNCLGIGGNWCGGNSPISSCIRRFIFRVCRV